MSEFSDPADRLHQRTRRERSANFRGRAQLLVRLGRRRCAGTVVCGGAVLLAAGVSWGCWEGPSLEQRLAEFVS